eukprot:369370-Ditylum_brightwellii.AAC.1
MDDRNSYTVGTDKKENVSHFDYQVYKLHTNLMDKKPVVYFFIIGIYESSRDNTSQILKWLTHWSRVYYMGMPNIGGMLRRITQEFALMVTRIELWNLLAILYGGVKTTSRASPNIKWPKMVVVVASKPKPLFNGGPAIFSQSVI